MLHNTETSVTLMSAESKKAKTKMNFNRSRLQFDRHICVLYTYKKLTMICTQYDFCYVAFTIDIQSSMDRKSFFFIFLQLNVLRIK